MTAPVADTDSRPGFRGQAKRSAEGTAALRYAASFERDPALCGPDRLAGHFVRPRYALMARIAPLRHLLLPLYERAFPGAYHWNLVRTKHLDSILRAEVERGLAQLVLLGAGYDSRPYRFAEELRGTRMLEVDHPDTSQRKRAAVERRLGGAPANVSYVEIDFTAEDLGAKLADHGYDDSQRTLFVWEGVSMFLPAESVRELLGLVATQSAPGSSIAFDYLFRSVAAGEHSPYGAHQQARFMERGGEPWLFGIEPNEVEGFVSHRGLTLLSNLGPDELEARHLMRGDGCRGGRITACFGIAHAGVSA